MPGWFRRAAASASRSVRAACPYVVRVFGLTTGAGRRLDRRVALKLEVVGAPDHAEAAGAQALVQPVPVQRDAPGDAVGPQPQVGSPSGW